MDALQAAAPATHGHTPTELKAPPPGKMICFSDMFDDFALIHFKFHRFRFHCGSHLNYNCNKHSIWTGLRGCLQLIVGGILRLPTG